MKTCPVCQAQVDDSAKFCTNCGAIIPQAAPSTAVITEIPEVKEEPIPTVTPDPIDETTHERICPICKTANPMSKNYCQCGFSLSDVVPTKKAPADKVPPVPPQGTYGQPGYNQNYQGYNQGYQGYQAPYNQPYGQQGYYQGYPQNPYPNNQPQPNTKLAFWLSFFFGWVVALIFSIAGKPGEGKAAWKGFFISIAVWFVFYIFIFVIVAILSSARIL